jgi:hypothetical protein
MKVASLFFLSVFAAQRGPLDRPLREKRSSVLRKNMNDDNLSMDKESED